MKTKNNNNKSILFSEKQLSKFVIIFVSMFVFVSISGVKQTCAYLSSEAKIGGIEFKTGTLDVTANKEGKNIIELGNSENYTITNTGSLPFTYENKIEIEDGSDIDFCNELNITVFNNESQIYKGDLLGFSSTGSLDAGENSIINYMISRPDILLMDKVCSFNLTSKAWQSELNYTQGFTDISVLENTLYLYGTDTPDDVSGVVINEFLPNPDGYEYGFDFGSDNSDMPQGEWIELYNNSDTSVDLSGWYLKDNIGNKVKIDASHVSDGSLSILPHGWLVVYMNNNILNNTIDSILLFNDSDVVMDSVSYGLIPDYCKLEPTSGVDNNSNPSNPSVISCLGVPGNKSYARIPDGIGAWVDPVPTPGIANDPEIVEIVFSEVKTEITSDLLVKEEDITKDLSLKTEEIILVENKIIEPSVIEEEIIKTDSIPEKEKIVVEGLVSITIPDEVKELPVIQKTDDLKIDEDLISKEIQKVIKDAIE